MSDKSTIEWTDATWNPVRGCTHVSAGCDHCYAAALAWRYGQREGQPFYGLAEKGADGIVRFTGEVRPVPKHLDDPLRWREPRRIFVNSMSDLFHITLTRQYRDYLDAIFAVMALAPRHTFQVLTKRPALVAKYLADRDTPRRVSFRLWRFVERHHKTIPDGSPALFRVAHWPLPNVWLGTSVESQREAPRIRALLDAPAAVLFLSCEPLLGPLDLDTAGAFAPDPALGMGTRPGVGWVIVGGESGANHRPLNLDWARGIRDACQRAGVPFFFKQVGGYTPKAGGRTLDGRTWDEYPAPIADTWGGGR